MIKNKGFTIIEITIVIILLAIISVYVGLKSPNQSDTNLEIYKMQVKQAIVLTKSLSISLNERYRIVFTSNTYNITDSLGTAYVNPILGAGPYSAPSGITFSTNIASNTLIFDGLGAPYSAAAQLTANGVVTITSSSNSRVVTIIPYTGEIE